MRKWLCIMYQNLDASDVGLQIAATDTEQEAISWLSKVFGGKSENTVHKRANCMKRFIAWVVKEDSSRVAIPFDSKVVTDYMWRLNTMGKYGSIIEFVETLAFCFHVVGIRTNFELDSNVVLKGLLRSARVSRKETKQSRPLTVKEVHALEDALIMKRGNKVDLFGIGVFLFQIYARARVSDIRNIHSLEVDITNGHGYIEAKTFDHKSKRLLGSLGLSLLLIAPINGVHRQSWGLSFIEAGKDVGIDLTRGIKGPLQVVSGCRELHLDSCIKSVRDGHFLPDMTRSGQFADVGEPAAVASTMTSLRRDALRIFSSGVKETEHHSKNHDVISVASSPDQPFDPVKEDVPEDIPDLSKEKQDIAVESSDESDSSYESSSESDTAIETLAHEHGISSLSDPNVKTLVENKVDETKLEMAPAERTHRIADQRGRLAGMTLTGELECGYCCYDLVMKVAQHNSIVYLPPHKFVSRKAELGLDKPKKELTIEANSTVTVKDKSQELSCSTSTDLHLQEALTRPTAPPGYSKTSIQQVLRADKEAWLRLAEKLTDGVKRRADGVLPLDEELRGLQSDPKVVFLLPLPDTPVSTYHISGDGGDDSWPEPKGKGKGKGKLKRKWKAPKNMPAPLAGKQSETKRKLTRLVHTLEKLTSMCAKCPGESETHKPLAWGMSDRMWATAEETAYPVPLCKTWAGLVLDQLLALGGIAPAASLADRVGKDHRAAQAMLGHQAKSKRLPPLVKEFKDIFYMVCNPQQIPPVTVQTPIDAECDHNFPQSFIPAGSRIVRTQILGVKKTSASNVSNDVQDDIPLHEDCDDHGVLNQIKVFMGVPWTPKEFIEQASNLQHPKHIVQSLDMFLKEVIYNNANTDFLHIGRDRINAMRKWTSKAKELEDVEKEVKAKLPEHCFEVLRHKRLSLFQDMLNDIGYDDKSIPSEMCVGFRLAGPIPPSPVFKKKRTSATLSVNDLRHSAHVTRQGIILSTVSSGDDELDLALQAATDKELEKGWLWGPIDFSSLPETACVSRRFGIWQGGKCRPIDNLKESGINATTSAADTITVHTADYTAAGIAYKMSCGTTDELSIKTWDLRKAYKNLPVHLESLNDNYLSVFHPGEGSARVYGQRVLPFGSRASVHGFVRVAVALWTLAVKIFRIHWSVYFDDFICVEYSSLSRLTDMCICNFFNLLGWETSDDKDSVFSSVAKFLGLEIDLSSVRLGCFTMQNTQKRRTEIADSIDVILKSGKLPRKEAASLRGRLIFAECQIAGRTIVPVPWTSPAICFGMWPKVFGSVVCSKVLLYSHGQSKCKKTTHCQEFRFTEPGLPDLLSLAKFRTASVFVAEKKLPLDQLREEDVIFVGSAFAYAKRCLATCFAPAMLWLGLIGLVLESLIGCATADVRITGIGCDSDGVEGLRHAVLGALLGDSYAWTRGDVPSLDNLALADEEGHSSHGLELLQASSSVHMLMALRVISVEGFEFRRFSQAWRTWADFIQEAAPDRGWSPGAVEALNHLREGAPPEAAAGHYVDFEAAARIPALLLLAEHADDNGLVMASHEMQRVTHENPKVLQAGEFFLRAALHLLRAPKPCTDTDAASTRKMRQQAMLSALRQAATSGEQFHGLVDEVMAEVQSRESVLSVTGELTGTLASLHSDAQVIGRLTASGEAPGDEVQSEKTSFAIPAILWFVLAYDSLPAALEASTSLGGALRAVAARAVFVGFLLAARDGVSEQIASASVHERLPLSFQPLLSAPVLRLCAKPGACHEPGRARRLNGVAVDAAMLPEPTCASGRHCYRIFMRFDASSLLDLNPQQPDDWDEEEDGPWSPDSKASCLARYFQFFTASGRHAPFGLWPAHAMCQFSQELLVWHDSFEVSVPEPLSGLIGGAVLRAGHRRVDAKLPSLTMEPKRPEWAKHCTHVGRVKLPPAEWSFDEAISKDL
eukprot:symbB.v1.2.010159.t3/scaffold660.1/size175713/16